MNPPSLSFLIPLYNSAETIAALVHEIAALSIEGGHEIVLVDDGSSDRTEEVCQRLLAEAKVPITFVSHARNFGEHNAVLTGLRLARGSYIVTLDDDGQNPPSEGKRLYEFARAQKLDVVFARHPEKQHHPWRNLTSALNEKVSDWILDKPRGFYVSTFRCMSGWLAQELGKNTGPFPYIDGLILQTTQRIGTLEVSHQKRVAGQSGYTLRRLVRLWLSTIVNFSVMPLRIATVLGIAIAGTGFLGMAWVLYITLKDQRAVLGWESLMSVFLAFSGTQLIVLGLLGEYLGRLVQTINQRPQSVVREVFRSAETK